MCIFVGVPANYLGRCFMFQGSSALVLDSKGRMAVPVRHRELLSSQYTNQLTLTRHPEGCVLVFPRSEWMQHRVRLAAMPISARPWTRIFLGSAEDVEIDGSGRVLITPELREAVGLSKKVMLLGMGNYLEIWDAAVLADKEKEAIQAGMPEVIANFNF